MGALLLIGGTLFAVWYTKQQAGQALPPTQAPTSAPVATCSLSVPVPASTAGMSNAANESFATMPNGPALAPGTGASSTQVTCAPYPVKTNGFAVLQAHPVVKTYPWVPLRPRATWVQPNERGNTWGNKPPRQTGLTFLNAGGLVINNVPVPGNPSQQGSGAGIGSSTSGGYSGGGGPSGPSCGGHGGGRK